MSNVLKTNIKHQISKKRSALSDSSVIKINNIMNSEKFLHVIEQCRQYRERIFTPFITLLTFIQQVLDPDKSCKKAISKVIAEQISRNAAPCAHNTGSYCKARKRLPETTVHTLVQETEKEMSIRVPVDWKWKNRNVKVVDGTTVIMPDTQENQQDYPQHKKQAKGAGFPIARILVIFSLSTGAIIDYALAAIRGEWTGEHSLLESIMNILEKNDVLLGDAYFPSFFLLADLYARDCDGVFKGQTQRNYDFRKGEQLGTKDHIVEWKRPEKPSRMMQDKYANYPNSIRVRECKVGGKVYVTTLLDDKKYGRKEIVQLYRLRWQGELNLNSIKTIMGMEMLSCKTPDMIKKEIGIHFLAYNIIRIIMAESASRYRVIPSHMSFKSTVQFINSFMPVLVNVPRKITIELYEHLLKVIAEIKVGNRPWRREPRAVKKHPKGFPRLKMDRKKYKDHKVNLKYAIS